MKITLLAICEDLVGNSELSPESNPKKFPSERFDNAASGEGIFKGKNLKSQSH